MSKKKENLLDKMKPKNPKYKIINIPRNSNVDSKIPKGYKPIAFSHTKLSKGVYKNSILVRKKFLGLF